MNEKLFIRLGQRKNPIDKWKTTRFTSAEVKLWHKDNPKNNYAFVPPLDYVVIDADDLNAVNTVTKMNKLYGISPLAWNTTKGRHFLYKCTRLRESNARDNVPKSLVGVKYNIFGGVMDYKGNDGGYVMISNRIDPDTVLQMMKEAPELPIMLWPNRGGFDIKHNYAEGEQHETMFRMWIPKLRKNWTNDKALLKELLFDITRKYHEAGHDDQEIKSWVDTNVDSSFEKGMIENQFGGKYGAYIAQSKVGVPNAVVNYEGLFLTLIEELKLVRDVQSKQIWGMEDDEFKVIEDLGDLVRHEIFEHEPNVKPAIISELIMALPSRIPRLKSQLKENEIPFLNGVYNVFDRSFTSELPPFSPNKISFEYLKGTDEEFKKEYKEDIRWVTELFTTWATDIQGKFDKDIVTEMFELIGYSMTSLTELEKAYFLVGNAMNGKSVFLKLIETILGPGNVASEDLADITDGVFSSSQLYGKLVNINADISSNIIKDPATFKKLVSGDRVSAQFKGKDPFNFAPKAKLIFGVNNIPYVAEGGESDAVDRRMKLIHFRNKFKKSKHFYKVKTHLYSDKIVQVIIRLSLDAFHAMWERDALLTESLAAKVLTEQYLLDTDHVFEFLNALTILDSTPVDDLYIRYKGWSDINSYRAVGKGTFIKKVVKFYRRRGFTTLKENNENGKAVFRFYGT